MINKLHVIFGTGPLGRSVMNELLGRGKQVRMVSRSGKMQDVPKQVEVRAADAYDLEQARVATKNASVIYNCAAPSYSAKAWETDLPKLWGNILEAAISTKAKLVIGDNLYMYDQAAGDIHENRPYESTTRKGQARSKVAEAMLKAHREGKAQVTFGRGSSFFGPYASEQSQLGSRVFPALLKGKAVSMIGNIDVPHTLTYIGDFGKALVILGEHDEAFGQAWHVPNAPTKTKREVLELAARLANKPLKVSTMGPIMLRIGGLFVPAAREVPEMLYQYNQPYIVDSSKFVKALGDSATPLEQALTQTIAWYAKQAPSNQPGNLQAA
jgi:nucleoside-diphosphate-sugar epimerase